MALEFLHELKGIGPMGETVTVTEYWYLTEDKTRVVRESDPDQRWLWASPGQQVDRAQAEALGAIPKPVAEQPADPDPEISAESGEAAPDVEPTPAEDSKPKARKPTANKARSKGEDK